MDVGFLTDNGKMRSHNEDAFFVSKKNDLFIVADGVGGQNAGEIASRMAASQVAEYIAENMDSEKSEASYIFGCITDGLDQVNQNIYERSKEDASCFRMATTIVLMYLTGSVAYFANLGDSRAYLMRNQSLIQITEDHTLVNKYIKEGKFTKEQMEGYPDASMLAKWSHTITKALGDAAELEADYFIVEVLPGDMFLLCSDGLYGEVSDEKIAQIILEKQTAQHACEKLILSANENGGGDNITVILVRNGEMNHE